MLLEKRIEYKPFKYPWAFDAYRLQQSIHWLPTEVNLHQDVIHWNKELTSGQKEFLTQLFRFFTQADVSVAEGYSNKFLPLFSGNPEVCMMLTSFASMEGVHVDAYSLIVETLGFPESEYSEFLAYKAMKDKYDYIQTIRTDTPLEIAKSLAVYSAFTEGMQLFSSFAMLLHFSRAGIGKMPAMSNIVRWSLRDESLHSDNMIKLYNTFVSEYIGNDLPARVELREHILSVAEIMLQLEHSFIEQAFNKISVEDLNQGLAKTETPLTKELLKEYAKHMTQYRLKQIGCFSGEIIKTPLPWLNEIMQTTERANFFEVKPTEYSKAAIKGNITNW